MKICKVCNEKLMEDDYHLLLVAYRTYKFICEKYDDLLDGHDNSYEIPKSPPRRVSTYVRAFFSH